MRLRFRHHQHRWVFLAVATLVAVGVGVYAGLLERPPAQPPAGSGQVPPPPEVARLELPLTDMRPLADPPPISQLPVPNFGDRPAGTEPYAIVLHGTGGGTPGSADYGLRRLRQIFRDPDRPVSAHFGIDRRGNIARFVPEERRAWHVAAEGWNDVSIGIELINDNSGFDPFPAAQMRALRQLVRWLGSQYDIPVEYVYRHRDLQPWDRSDPPDNFPMRSFLASIG